jgi:hypothetical protein
MQVGVLVCDSISAEVYAGQSVSLAFLLVAKENQIFVGGEPFKRLGLDDAPIKQYVSASFRR